MVGPSKILTVSYGTFSCTLEGFDDSFDTMKAIAEYFRDLASDDRYFGAEPPTPDAEMLARIAEREVARRVEARTDGHGITLRTGSALAPIAAPRAAPAAPVAAEPAYQPAPAQPEVAPRAAESRPAPVQAPVETPVAQAEAMPDAAPESPQLKMPPIPQPARPTPMDADSVAAKLQRIRAVVGRNAAMQPTDTEDDEGDFVPSATGPSETAPIDGLATPDAQPEIEAADNPFDMSAFAEDAYEEDADAPTEASATLADAWANEDADVPDIEAADETAVRFEDFAAAEPHAVDTADSDAETDAELRAEAQFDEDIEFDVSAEDDAESAEDETEAEAEAEAEAEQDAPTDAPPEPSTAEQPRPAKARVVRMRRADFERAVAEGDLRRAQATASEAGNVDAATTETETETSDAVHDSEIGAETGLSAEDEAALLTELAALELDVDQLDDEETDVAPASLQDGDQTGDADVTIAETDRRADDNATAGDDADDADAGEDSLRDIELPVETAARIDGTDDSADEAIAEVEAAGIADDSTAPSVSAEHDDHGHLRHELDEDEIAMSRILSATDAKLNDPESSRRRQAISQLKAAVAATEAARQLGEVAQDDGTIENAFRDDLRQAVRPRRPVHPVRPERVEVEAESNRPERVRPAPLKLVASQRVDLPRTAATGGDRPMPRQVTPIRPRRVSVDLATAAAPAPVESEFEIASRIAAEISADLADDDDDDIADVAAPRPIRSASGAAQAPRGSGSFAEFADRMGAHGLSDLLEAAAAYTSFVEGIEDFSRPQLMQKVRSAMSDPVSREDGLRSFGTLLRQGMLTKVRNGRFQVSEDTRFNPQRRVG